MTAGQNGSSNGGGRPLWVAGLSPPDSWRSLRQPGNPQLHQVRHPQHRVWGHESKPEVSNFRLAKVSNFRLGLTAQRACPGSSRKRRLAELRGDGERLLDGLALETIPIMEYVWQKTYRVPVKDELLRGHE